VTPKTDPHPGPAEARLEAKRRRVSSAARIALSDGGGLTDRVVADVSEQAGVHVTAFRVLFPTDDSLLDAVNEVLVEECADRLRGGVARFVPAEGQTSFSAAARALAESLPLDRGSIVIRADRRLRALRRGSDGAPAAAAERRYVEALVEVLDDMVHKLGRRFSWPPMVAVRLILDTYERSFEAWLLGGNDESQFHLSTYVGRTLPMLLEQFTEPAADQR